MGRQAAGRDHPGARAVSQLHAARADRRGRTHRALELSLVLGGKSPNIVFADADLDNAVKGVINGIFYNKGEVCSAGSRALIESSIYDDFVQRLVKRAQSLTPGDPLDPKTRMGPVVSKE